MATSDAIKVGPEWFAVVDAVTGAPDETVVTSEQCDNCGGNTFHRCETKTHFSTGTVKSRRDAFTCATCETVYPISQRTDDSIIWTN